MSAERPRFTREDQATGIKRYRFTAGDVSGVVEQRRGGYWRAYAADEQSSSFCHSRREAVEQVVERVARRSR